MKKERILSEQEILGSVRRPLSDEERFAFDDLLDANNDVRRRLRRIEARHERRGRAKLIGAVGLITLALVGTGIKAADDVGEHLHSQFITVADYLPNSFNWPPRGSTSGS